MAVMEDKYGYLWVGTDGGLTWQKINDQTVSGRPAFSPDFTRDRTFVAAMRGTSLVISSDEGRTLKNRVVDGLRRLAVAVPFFLLALLVLACFADPVEQKTKPREAGSQVQEAAAGAEAGASAR